MNSEQDLINFLKRYKNKKVFIISGKNSFFINKADKFFKRILNNYFVYIKLSKNPILEELKNITKKLMSFEPELIIAFGGGSTMDYAKIANVVANPSKIKLTVIDQKIKLKKRCKLLAIPTTAGSGAEVTPSAVIYYNKIKYSLESDKIKPDYYFLIPKYLKLLKKKIKASSGFDAISQAIESIFSLKSNQTSLEFAKKSLRISFKNYLNFLDNPKNSNEYNMLLSANLSGKAIAISKTATPHALSYPFTSLFNIDHGHAVSLTLNNVLKFNYENMEKSHANFDLKSRYKILFELTKTNSINELDEYLKFLKKEANLHSNLRKFNLDIKKDYIKILNGTNIKRLKNNPIILDRNVLKKILLKI